MRRSRLPSLLALGLALATFVGGVATAAPEGAPNRRPVKAVADQRLQVRTAAGSAALALYASLPLSDTSVHADVERAVIVLHGRLRDADVYWRSAQAAARAAPEASSHAMLVVPQFLAERDVIAHGLAPDTLRWTPTGWESGDAAIAPAPISSFEALDALLTVLADRARFPNLARVIVAGHSGGGQVVQRYAVVGQGETRLAALGIAVRYVAANPSSYLYFSADRPHADGTFAPLPRGACPGYDSWKYGWQDAPAYARSATPAAYEGRYLQRDVVYLLGAADTDPQQAALDKSCAGEAQGPDRLARGHSYVDYLRLRHPGLTPTEHDVPGVGHDGDRMLRSACGLAALFDGPRDIAACTGGATR